MRWVAPGNGQNDIALSRGLSERTIKNYLRHIRKRLGAASTAQASTCFSATMSLRPEPIAMASLAWEGSPPKRAREDGRTVRG